LTPEEPATIIIDQTILDGLEHFPFSFIRELARLTCIPTTVHQYFTQSFGFVVKRLCLVPHTLTSAQKKERATLLIGILRQLRSIKHHSRQLIITFDEAWFDLSPDDEQIWLRAEEQPLKDRGIPSKTQK
jgi:hypothetical protein